MSVSSISRWVLVTAAAGLLAGAVAGGVVGACLWALGVPAATAALAILAAPRRSRRVLLAIATLAAVVQASLVLLALGVGAGGTAGRIAGLPPATWWMLVGLGLAPLVGVPVLYALAYRAPGAGRKASGEGGRR